MKARIFIRALGILLRRVPGFLRLNWRIFLQRLFPTVPSHSIEFLDGWRWRIDIEKHVVILESTTDNPSFSYHLSEFRQFLAQSRQAIKLEKFATIRPMDKGPTKTGLISISCSQTHVTCEVRNDFLWISHSHRRQMETGTFELMLTCLEDRLSSEYQALLK